MIIESGHFALILALFTALVQATLPFTGAEQNNPALMAAGGQAARVQFVLISFAFAALIWAYVTSDFSVLNVVRNSHIDKPLIYKITGVWSNHEGSMMLWIFVLALYGLALSIFGGNLPPTLQARALGTQGIISAGFLLFILLTSNPFLRLDPAPLRGEGLNPILQDRGLAFHPPILYLGYVGFSMAFSFAIAALLEGRVDASWARWVRPWTLAAWCFLTLGIAMGSWWAYYTLGWGGWWYWDPVENASFVPWLAGTALLHSAIVAEKRDTLKAWTVLLAIVTFSFSLIGTFLVRSGVLTSVHSFASDPSRGIFILLLLAVLIGGALLLFFLRAPTIKSGGFFAPISREGALLLNNMFLSVAAGTVLLGTLYPIFIEVMGLGQISVGPPFFNIVFVPLMVPLIIAMGIGPMLSWKRGDLAAAMQRLMFAVVAALAVLIAVWLLNGGSANTLAAAGGLGLAAWLFTATLLQLAQRVALFRVPLGESFNRAFALPRAAWGMTIAHAGVAVLLAGITGSLAWKVEDIRIMHPGESFDIAGYHVTFKGVEDNIHGRNFIASRATFDVTKNGAFVTEMMPQRRAFDIPPQTVTRTAIHTNFISDLYGVIGASDGQGGYVTRFYYNPLVPWVFLGGVIMALGGGISLTDRRLRVGAPRRVTRKPIGRPKSVMPANAVPNRWFLVPLTAFAVLGGFFVWQLLLIENGHDPEIVTSVLINKPAPEMDLPPLLPDLPGVRTEDLKGKVTLVNFFATWCVPCQAEHPNLSLLAAAEGLTLVGISYKDKPDDVRAWLKKSPNPYAAVASDPHGVTAIDFGITGVPESYVIDKKGIIRFKYTGPLTPEVIKARILPLVQKLNE